MTTISISIKAHHIHTRFPIMTAISPSGGFLPSPLTITPITSPAPSHNSLTSSLSDSLPRPRSHALRAGSKKEEAARRYIEGRLLAVSRRFVKKFQEAQVGEAIIGYTRFSQVCRDLSEILDVVWLSGTRMSFSTYFSALFGRCHVIFFKIRG